MSDVILSLFPDNISADLQPLILLVFYIFFMVASMKLLSSLLEMIRDFGSRKK